MDYERLRNKVYQQVKNELNEKMSDENLLLFVLLAPRQYALQLRQPRSTSKLAQT